MKAMLEYAKTILPRVSFSNDLFRKELLKCIGWIEPDEIDDLKRWAYDSFNEQFPEILDEVFAHVAA